MNNEKLTPSIKSKKSRNKKIILGTTLGALALGITALSVVAIVRTVLVARQKNTSDNKLENQLKSLEENNKKDLSILNNKLVEQEKALAGSNVEVQKLTELIKNKENLILVRNGHIEALSNRINVLLSQDPTERELLVNLQNQLKNLIDLNDTSKNQIDDLTSSLSDKKLRIEEQKTTLLVATKELDKFEKDLAQKLVINSVLKEQLKSELATAVDNTKRINQFNVTLIEEQKLLVLRNQTIESLNNRLSLTLGLLDDVTKNKSQIEQFYVDLGKIIGTEKSEIDSNIEIINRLNRIISEMDNNLQKKDKLISKLTNDLSEEKAKLEEQIAINKSIPRNPKDIQNAIEALSNGNWSVRNIGTISNSNNGTIFGRILASRFSSSNVEVPVHFRMINNNFFDTAIVVVSNADTSRSEFLHISYRIAQ